MHLSRIHRHRHLTAKNFAIAMVLVNATGLVMVQQKMKGAQVDDAYALDDGVRPITFSHADLPDRLVLPEIELTASTASRPAVELPEMAPLPEVQLSLADAVPEVAPAPIHQVSPKPQGVLAVAAPAPIAVPQVESLSGIKLTRVDHMPVPVTAKAPTAAPVPIEAGDSLAAPQAGLDSFAAAFGQAKDETAITVSSPNTMVQELDAVAPSAQAPVTDASAGAEKTATITLPSPTAIDMLPIKPIVPFAEPTELLPAAV